ncbi:MAG TPA: hypothetical protein VGB91_03480 [Rhizomicrobium sp.]
MRTVTLGIGGAQAATKRAVSAFRGRRQGARISFATPELLFGVLTTKRWEIIRAMTGAGPLSIRETARLVGRDVKAVHGDVQALLMGGILRKTTDRRVEFPFDAIHVDVTLKAA